SSESSVQIKVPGRLRDRLLASLTERFLEAARQRVAARLLVGARLLEDRLSPRLLFGEDALRLAHPRLVGALRLVVRDDPSEVQIDDERGLAAGAGHFEFGLEARHYCFPPS